MTTEMTALKKKMIADYIRMLTHLDNDAKVVLIKALADSMQEKETKSEPTWKKLYGAWDGDETAEELVAWLRTSRNFNRADVQF